MAGRTAFVTGGSGFIGGHLVRRLVSEGWTVRALARSDRAAARVAELGAHPAPGDLHAADAVERAATGAQIAFHVAAEVADWAPEADYERANVVGTRTALDACRRAGVDRFVHLSTEAVLMAGRPLVAVDETAPLRPDSPAPYPATKARAERTVVGAAAPGFDTVVVRPRLVWGPGDTTVLPGLLDAVRGGRFAWIGGGHHLTATTHVANVVEGLLLAAERGLSGRAYFVTDGPAVEFREFVTRLLATAGVTPPGRTLPVPVATAVAVGGEAAWRALHLPGRPPLTRMALWLSAQECTIDTSRARTELGYQPVVDRDAGLAELARSSDPATPDR